MSKSREDIIQGAAKKILDDFPIWDAEAHQACQAEESGNLYEPFMMQCLIDVIDKAFRDEQVRTQSYDQP